MPQKTKAKIIFIIVLFLVLPSIVGADTWGQRTDFSVDPFYDELTRNRLTATLRKVSSKVYFYIDDEFWNSLNSDYQNNILASISILSSEFENRIYPTLTSNFGSEWSPGIDKDGRITILIHPMGEGVGGYFNSSDEYSRFQIPTSNEREMIYLNSEYIDKEIIKSYLAHEFTHLITFYQKEIIYGISEETWLNEARAEYVSTLLGYDEDFEGSNLELRVQEFLKSPSDSLTEWKNRQADYGVINIFVQYLIDHYGDKILADSLKSSKTGIPSLNDALEKNGFSEDFSQIFTNWTITVLVNDCGLGEKYCHKNQDLKRFIVIPSINFLPFVGESTLSIADFTKEWAGNWYKIVGGKGVLKLEFSGEKTINFKVPYVVTHKSGKREIKFLELNKQQKGTIYVSDFSTENTSLTIIPSAQLKLSGFGSSEPAYQFSFVVSTVERTPEEESELIEQLLLQIGYLQKEIAKAQAQIYAILGGNQSQVSCQKIESNLYYRLQNNAQVRCLQEFLKSQGSEIYPEGLVTGNFLSLTKQAVIRFQEKYASEILAPWGLTSGTGFVGEKTRLKINELLGVVY